MQAQSARGMSEAKEESWKGKVTKLRESKARNERRDL